MVAQSSRSIIALLRNKWPQWCFGRSDQRKIVSLIDGPKMGRLDCFVFLWIPVTSMVSPPGPIYDLFWDFVSGISLLWLVGCIGSGMNGFLIGPFFSTFCYQLGSLLGPPAIQLSTNPTS